MGWIAAKKYHRGSLPATVRPVPYPFQRLLPPKERPCTCFCASVDSRRRFSRGSRDGRGFSRAQKSSKRVLRNAVSRGGERLPSRRAVAERLAGSTDLSCEFADDAHRPLLRRPGP
jgi:hypothetical protein